MKATFTLKVTSELDEGFCRVTDAQGVVIYDGALIGSPRGNDIAGCTVTMSIPDYERYNKLKEKLAGR